jgi:hypothetical protein
MQSGLHSIGNCRLARTRQTSEPDHLARVSIQQFSFLALNASLMAVKILLHRSLM